MLKGASLSAEWSIFHRTPIGGRHLSIINPELLCNPIKSSPIDNVCISGAVKDARSLEELELN